MEPPRRKRNAPARLVDEVEQIVARAARKRNPGTTTKAPRRKVNKERPLDGNGTSDGDDSVPKRSKRSQRRPRDPMKPLGYALRLSEYHNYGSCGVSEEVESHAVIDEKVARLAAMIRESPHTVIHTGAGISTAAGIPDFRGVNGVWTRHQKGDPLPASERCWNNAQPTGCHMALAALVEANLVACVVTQNIDGLHLRSGVPRAKLAELHGNMFAEKCSSCGLVVARSFDCGGVGFRPTGRACHECGGGMIDQLLDWEDDLPERDFAMAEDHADKCKAINGLAICLGTSMQMTPARDWPCQASRMVIVNLQATVKDSEAALVIRGRCDDVCARLVAALGLAQHVRPFARQEPFVVSHAAEGQQWCLSVLDPLGAPCGFILAVQVRVPGSIDDRCLDRQPFALTLASPPPSLRLTVTFDRVPRGAEGFYQPPPMAIDYEVIGASSSARFEVDLTVPP